MNKTFKVIWNHSTQTWTAVSELAGTRKKSKSIKLTAISAALLIACGTAQAATHTAADDLVAIDNAAATVPAAEKPQATGNNAIAAGRKAKAETNNSVAIGPSAEVLKQPGKDFNSNGIAIGAQARIEPKVNGNAETGIFHNSIAIGTRTLATASHAVVIAITQALCAIRVPQLIKRVKISLPSVTTPEQTGKKALPSAIIPALSPLKR